MRCPSRSHDAPIHSAITPTPDGFFSIGKAGNKVIYVCPACEELCAKGLIGKPKPIEE